MTPAPTRDWLAAWRNGRRIRHLFHVYDISSAISTGSSVAVSALPHAAHRRIPTHYIESVTRTDSISMSGKMLSRVPGVNLYVQWPHLARSGGRWRFCPRRVLRRGGSEAPDQADRRQPRHFRFVRFRGWSSDSSTSCRGTSTSSGRLAPRTFRGSASSAARQFRRPSWTSPSVTLMPSSPMRARESP